jgi:hypothetical protein
MYDKLKNNVVVKNGLFMFLQLKTGNMKRERKKWYIISIEEDNFFLHILGHES